MANNSPSEGSPKPKIKTFIPQSIALWSANFSKVKNQIPRAESPVKSDSRSQSTTSTNSNSNMGLMTPDVESQQPLQLHIQDDPPLTWSTMTICLQGDNKTELQKIINDYGAKAAMFIYGGSKQETSILRATKVPAIECLKLLLDARPTPEIVDQPDCDGLSPFLMATQSTLPELMKILIDAGCEINFRDDDGYHALHILANNLINGKSQCLVFDSLEVLLDENGIDMNPRDRFKRTPLQIIVENINENNDNSQINGNLITFCRRLYENGSSLLIKTESGKTLEDILDEKEVLSAVKTNEPPKKHIRPWVSVLYDSLILKVDSNEINEIVKNQNKEQVRKNVNSWLGSDTILFYVVNTLNVEAVKLLLELGAEPWRETCSRQLPLHRALARGHYEIVEILLSHMKHSSTLDLQGMSFSLFCNLLENSKQSQILDSGVDRSTCLRRLFADDLKVDVNMKMNSKKVEKTILHVAASFNNQEALNLLIKHGAYIGAKQKVLGNDRGTAIDAINRETLESAMDNCIANLPPSTQKSDDIGENIIHPDYTLILKYDFLVPPETGKEQEETITNEVETLLKLRNSSNHKKAITHPLIQTFLYAKWRKILPLYILNLMIYLIFVSIITYFMYTITDLRVLQYQSAQSNMTSQDALDFIDSLNTRVWVSRFLLLPFILYTITREILQIVFTRKNYVYNIENAFEWILIVAVTFLVIVPVNPDLTRHISAWAMIIAWYEFILILGRAPPLAIYITMLRHVSWNFLKILFLYGSLILAFAISFNIILRPTKTSKEDSGWFSNFWTTLPKAIVMATGEFEYSDLSERFPAEIIYTISTILIFMAFLFVIFLVMMNIMNGMAVSDTTDVKEDATLYSLSSRLELIYLVEEMFLTFPFLRQFLHHFHILTGSSNIPQLLVKVNLEDKKKRIIYGKASIENTMAYKNEEDRQFLKLDNRTTKALKNYRMKQLEEEEKRERGGDPIEQCLSILKDIRDRNSDNK